ncbi:MAG: hypothetical protein JO314_00730, partial [Acidobacteria bacterium]|nr:hypothetical protein [Acidobacteriota bacterium]
MAKLLQSIVLIVLFVGFAAIGMQAETTGPSPTPTPMDMSSMPGMDMNPKPTPTPDISSMSGMKMPGMGGSGGMQMPSVTNLADPMSRDSSGTSWDPDSTPIYGRMKMSGRGMWMFMGTAFFRYTDAGSSRDLSVAGKGDKERFDAPSMFMAMYSHPLGAKAQFGFRAMLSLDPLIEQGYGYPLVLQTGEEYNGRPIHDRQHPHDLFSELAVSYSYKFSESRSFYLYAGYPGEPALGPPMYLHRISGSNIPDAPIGHHWQDAT